MLHVQPLWLHESGLYASTCIFIYQLLVVTSYQVSTLSQNSDIYLALGKLI